MVIKLYRCLYGNKNTHMNLREYTMDENHELPVGTIEEYYKLYPNENFEIIDNINGGTFITSHEAFIMSKCGDGNEDLL